MKDLLALYARYDGPLPRFRNRRTDRRYIEEMLRDLLHTIRLRRRRGERESLAPLVRRATSLLRNRGTNYKEAFRDRRLPL